MVSEKVLTAREIQTTKNSFPAEYELIFFSLGKFE